MSDKPEKGGAWKPGDPFVVDSIIAVCNGCGSERVYPMDPPLRSAEEFVKWHRGTPPPVKPCACGFPTCDLKLHMVPQN